MTQNTTREKVLSGLGWRFAERIGAQGVNFLVSLILARLLVPEDYGVIALITIFIDISYVFISAGIGTALVQQKDSDEIDFSTVFIFNVVSSLVCYIIIFFAAPFVARFYEKEIITQVLRVLGLTMILGGINGIQEAHVSKNMQFKKFFWATSIGTFISAIVGIALAFYGFGVWALVAQQLTNQTIDTIVLWIVNKWRPLLVFSFSRFKKLFSYGWKILVSSLIDSVYNNAYSLVIGKVYTSDLLGLYNKGQSFPRFIIGNINSTINSVIFPALSNEQEKKDRVIQIVKRSITTSSFIIFPAMAGLAAIAHPLVLILLTDKWEKCVIFLQLSCIIFAFWPVYTSNLEAIKALGRSDIFLKLEIIKKILGMLILVATIPFGIYVILIARCCSSVIFWVINSSPNHRLINYGFIEQFRDLFSTILLSCIMFLLVNSMNYLPVDLYLLLPLQMVVGGTVYVTGANILKIDAFVYIRSLIMNYAIKRKE